MQRPEEKPEKTSGVKILSIETSCDETAAAVTVDGREVLSNVIYSQIDLHTVYGGVVPEIASRAHIEKINVIVKKALSDSDCELSDIDAVAVTYGPGLIGAVLVGLSAAKAISYASKKPLIPVNHIEGHICANFVENPELSPPFLCLVMSGGHTHLVMVKDFGEYEILGRTRDDAVGEAFDKVARAIGLGYPGGPKIEKAAAGGDPFAIEFPRPRFTGEEERFDFSFSGLKSAVLNYLNGCAMKETEVNTLDVAASFQQTVIDVLCDRVDMALSEFKPKQFAIAGGVASNGAIRTALEELCNKRNVRFFKPSPVLCTDNAVMIGAAGYHEYLAGHFAGLDLNAYPALAIGERRF